MTHDADEEPLIINNAKVDKPTRDMTYEELLALKGQIARDWQLAQHARNHSRANYLLAREMAIDRFIQEKAPIRNSVVAVVPGYQKREDTPPSL